MSEIYFIYNNKIIANAIVRYIKYNMDINEIDMDDINDNYEYRKYFNKAKRSDLLIVEAFSDKDPKGFQFAKEMRVKALLLFYSGEIKSNSEGPNWLVLPKGLDKLSNKILQFLTQYEFKIMDYEYLEEKSFLLKNNNRHHL